MHRSDGVLLILFDIRRGTGCEFTVGVAGAQRVDELLVWQRTHELNIEVWRVTNTGSASRDFRFRDQIRDAADSSERNVAEGFGRFSPAEFARFLDISRASLLELKGHLRKGFVVGYLREDDYRGLDQLATRAIQAVARFQRYLRSPEARANAARRYKHRRDQRPT